MCQGVNSLGKLPLIAHYHWPFLWAPLMLTVEYADLDWYTRTERWLHVLSSHCSKLPSLIHANNPKSVHHLWWASMVDPSFFVPSSQTRYWYIFSHLSLTLPKYCLYLLHLHIPQLLCKTSASLLQAHTNSTFLVSNWLCIEFPSILYSNLKEREIGAFSSRIRCVLVPEL